MHCLETDMYNFYDPEDLTCYYFGINEDFVGQAGLNYWQNKERLFIIDQLSYMDLQEWCYDLDWVGC